MPDTTAQRYRFAATVKVGGVPWREVSAYLWLTPEQLDWLRCLTPGFRPMAAAQLLAMTAGPQVAEAIGRGEPFILENPSLTLEPLAMEVS